MKFTPDDNRKIRAALAACKLADIDLAVISEGKIRGLSESRNAAIISALELSVDPSVQIGITRLSELIKRLELFGDEILIEGEIRESKNMMAKLNIRGKAGKIEFRCTDVALIDKKYPKANNDQPSAVLIFTKTEVALISRAVKTLGAEQLTIQVKRDGAVHLESLDTSSDRFETDLSTPAQFVDEPYPSVFSYITSSSGVLLTLLDHSVRESNSSELVMMKSGNTQIKIFNHDITAIPRIQTGASNG